MPTLRISGSWEDGATLAQAPRAPVYMADTLTGWTTTPDRLVIPMPSATGPTGVVGPGVLVPSTGNSVAHRAESPSIPVAAGPLVIRCAAQARGYSQLAIQVGGSAAAVLGLPTHSWTSRVELAVVDTTSGALVRATTGVAAEVRLGNGWVSAVLTMNATTSGNITLCPTVRSGPNPRAGTDEYGFSGDGVSGITVACVEITTAAGRYITAPETDATVGTMQPDRTFPITLGHPLAAGATLTCADPPQGTRLDGTSGTWRFVPVQGPLAECSRFVATFPARTFETTFAARTFEVTP